MLWATLYSNISVLVFNLLIKVIWEIYMEIIVNYVFRLCMCELMYRNSWNNLFLILKKKKNL